MVMVRFSLSLLTLFWAVAAFSLTGVSAADSEAVTFTDPAQAGADYEIQGEYAGVVPSTDRGDRQIGVQVIALGEGNFRAVLYVGGLPGAGWSRGDATHSAEGRSEDGVVRFASDGNISAEVKEGAISILRNGEKVADLPKVQRKSPTLGAKPPRGAIVLFDGSSAGLWENGKLVEGKWLGATNTSTIQKFGDHKLHIEFRTPFMPNSRGQARGNSGVYVQGRYEVQVLDSFGLEGKSNECGGIYKVSEPAVHMCLPPLVWQTYDIDFDAARYNDEGEKTQNARITVVHNGVVILDDLELPQATPGRHAEGPGPDSLFLQDHRNPVVFRNIWLVEK